MKYEINDQGQIKLSPVMDEGNSIFISKPISKNDLENILCAVKKTQQKLANKDIQEFQDSKNKGYITGIDTIKFSNGITIQTERDELILYTNDGKRLKLG